MHAGVFNFPQAGCQQIGAIDLIFKDMGVAPRPIDHLVTGCVKPLPHL